MATPATIIDLNLPAIALVGRVNVGKSTLFNKITESKHALVSTVAGTTRTRNVATATWRGKQFRIIDTGGLTFDADVPLEEDIIHQTELAIAEADVILFVVDIQDGILPQERELAKRLHKMAPGKNILFVANKADTAELRERVHDREVLQLGLGEPLPVSAINGANLGDLLDLVYSKFSQSPKRPKRLKEQNPIRIAIMGKPNVGKSSLFNKLIGEDRVIVSPMAHTTREPHDTLVTYEKQPILFVDTAGIRRKTKVSGVLERAGIGQSLDMINKSDIVLILLDATEPISDQDQQLAGLLREHTKSVLIIVNKWDKAEGNEDSFRNSVKALVYKKFPHLDFAPVLFVSALNGYHTHQIFPEIIKAWNARQTEVDAEELRQFIKRAVRKHLPTRGKGTRHPEVLGMRQLGTNPPMFEMLIKPRTSVHISYVHYIENRLREQWSFYASPIVMKLSKMKK